MKLILHRRNTLEDLIATPTKYGIEVDIRSYGEKLVIHHEPFIEGPSFDTWLKAYKHGTLILNVKEEGLESSIIALMKAHRISNYFFLDQSFPFLIKWSKAGERRCAVRISEFESIATAMTLSGKVDWVWIDCFTYFPLSQHDVQRLKAAKFKLCLVSPELQGRDAEIEIPLLFRVLVELDIKPDAVCTKRPEIWEEMMLDL